MQVDDENIFVQHSQLLENEMEIGTSVRWLLLRSYFNVFYTCTAHPIYIYIYIYIYCRCWEKYYNKCTKSPVFSGFILSLLGKVNSEIHLEFVLLRHR